MLPRLQAIFNEAVIYLSRCITKSWNADDNTTTHAGLIAVEAAAE